MTNQTTTYQPLAETGEEFIARHTVFHDTGQFTSGVPKVVGDMLYAEELLDYSRSLESTMVRRISTYTAKSIGSMCVDSWLMANMDVIYDDAALVTAHAGLSLKLREFAFVLSPKYEDRNQSIHTDGPTNHPLLFYLSVAGAQTRYYPGDFWEPLPLNGHVRKLDDQVGEPVYVGRNKIVRGDFSTLHQTPAAAEQGEPRVVIRMKAFVSQ